MEDFRPGEGPEANWPWEDVLTSLERNWDGDREGEGNQRSVLRTTHCAGLVVAADRGGCDTVLVKGCTCVKVLAAARFHLHQPPSLLPCASVPLRSGPNTVSPQELYLASC